MAVAGERELLRDIRVRVKLRVRVRLRVRLRLRVKVRVPPSLGGPARTKGWSPEIGYAASEAGAGAAAVAGRLW